MTTPLEQLAAEFKYWRSTRTKRTRTPQHLSDKTLAILPQYKTSEVLAALKISPSALSRWKREVQPSEKNIEEPKPEFVPLRTTPPTLNGEAIDP